MSAIAIILTLILTVCGKAIGNILIYLARQLSEARNRRLIKLEQLYQNNPTEVRRLLLELELTKQELATAINANHILKQQLEKTGKKHSCFCERLRILILYLTNNINPKDLESLLKYSYRTISRWLTNLKRYGILGIIPRGQLPWPVKNQTSPKIVSLIWQIHNENPIWGRWRIAQTLWRLLIFIAPSTVRNILKRPRPNKRSWWKPKKPLDLGPHLKKIIAKAKDHIWSIDLHPVMIGPYQSYILGILDHFSRKILHLGVHLGEPGSSWVINQLRSVIAEYTVPAVVITDHGSQFVSNEFKRFIEVFEIDHRKGRVGSPYSNGKLERFFGSLKREVLNQFPLLTESRLTQLVRDYAHYYNNYRPHQALEGALPEETYHHNRIFPANPPKANKRLLGKVKRIGFCEGLLNAYMLN